MISGGSPVARRVRTVLLLLGAGVWPSLGVGVGAEPGAPAGWGIEQLMQGLAQVKSARAAFVERKYLVILTVPIESSGTLVYIAPNRLEKYTLVPTQESLVLDRDRLTLENKALNQRRSFSLQDHPAIWALVESIRSTLAGDLATLNRHYRVTLDGDERQWRLTMKPGEPGMQKFVSEILIGGRKNRVNTIEIVETQGDRSVMTITGDAP